MKDKLSNNEILYVVYISTRFDEILKKYFTVFRIETIQEFQIYRYEIDVNVFKRQNRLVFRMRGLKASKILMPGGGRAFFEKEFEDLTGKYIVEIIGINKKINTFEINIHDDLIKISVLPKTSFLEIRIL